MTIQLNTPHLASFQDMAIEVKRGTQYLQQVEQTIDPIAKGLSAGITASNETDNDYSHFIPNQFSAYMQALANSASDSKQTIIDWKGTYNASLTTSTGWTNVIGSGANIITPRVSISGPSELTIPAAFISNLTKVINILLSPTLVMNGFGTIVAPQMQTSPAFYYTYAEIAQLQAKGQTGQLYNTNFSQISGNTGPIEGYIINPSTIPTWSGGGYSGPAVGFTAANLPSSARMSEILNLSSTIYLSTPV